MKMVRIQSFFWDIDEKNSEYWHFLRSGIYSWLLSRNTIMNFFIKNFLSKYDQIRRKVLICSDFLRKSLMEDFTFCAMYWSESKGPQKTLCQCYLIRNDKIRKSLRQSSYLPSSNYQFVVLHFAHKTQRKL